MRVTMTAIDNVSETFDTKRGTKTLKMVVLQDLCKPPLRNTVDYELSPSELAKYNYPSTALIGKQLVLDVREISQNFSGRVRFASGDAGGIVEVSK